MGKYTDESNRAPERKASHGLTFEQLDELHIQEASGNVDKVPCNEDSSFSIPVVEAPSFYYLEMEAPYYDPLTGEKLSAPKFVKYHERHYKHMMDHNSFNGYRVRTLHSPVKYRESLKAASSKTKSTSTSK